MADYKIYTYQETEETESSEVIVKCEGAIKFALCIHSSELYKDKDPDDSETKQASNPNNYTYACSFYLGDDTTTEYIVNPKTGIYEASDCESFDKITLKFPTDDKGNQYNVIYTHEEAKKVATTESSNSDEDTPSTASETEDASSADSDTSTTEEKEIVYDYIFQPWTFTWMGKELTYTINDSPDVAKSNS